MCLDEFRLFFRVDWGGEGIDPPTGFTTLFSPSFQSIPCHSQFLVLVLTLASCVALDKLLYFSWPPFFHL